MREVISPEQKQGHRKLTLLSNTLVSSCPAIYAGIALVFPDTSPRGANIQDEDKDWDFGASCCATTGVRSVALTSLPVTVGTGAGFYLNATKEPWKKHYNM